MCQDHLAPALARHPDGAVLQLERLGELNHGGVQDRVAIERLADLVREHPHVPTRFLLPLHHPHLPVPLPRLDPEEVLPDLAPEQLRYEREQRDRGGERHQGGQELGDGEREHDVERVRLVGEHGDEVGEAAEHDEGAELQDDPLEREEVGAGGEVEQLERDGEVGHGDEEVAHPLALQDVVRAPYAAAAVAVVAAAAVAEIGGSRGGQRQQQPGEEDADPQRWDRWHRCFSSTIWLCKLCNYKSSFTGAFARACWSCPWRFLQRSKGPPRFLIPPRRFACKSNKRTNHVYSFFSNTKQDLDVKTPLITKDEIDKKKKKSNPPKIGARNPGGSNRKSKKPKFQGEEEGEEEKADLRAPTILPRGL